MQPSLRAVILCACVALSACTGQIASNRDSGDGGDSTVDAQRGDVARMDAGDGGNAADVSDAMMSPDVLAPDGLAVTFCTTQIPLTEPEIRGPGRGGEQWHDQTAVDIPIEGAPVQPMDMYYRFQWVDLETSSDHYDWTQFDAQINGAIDRHQKFSFGMMTTCPGCTHVTFDGAQASYPAYLHSLMQAESVHDWVSGGMWVPNWNSEAYLSRFEALLRALNAHLASGSHAGARYRDVIGYIDVRGYGSWGEWHVAFIADSADAQPSGAATAASLTRLIDAHVNAFPDFQLVTMICAFDGGRFGNMGVPPEVGYHALTAHNNVGPLGWRRDNWGAVDSYLRDLLDMNTISYSGMSFSGAIMSRWQTSPVVGEPISGGSDSGGSCEYYDLETQVRRYHAASFGDGNFGDTAQMCMRDNVRAASKASGYRLVLDGGTTNATLAPGGSFAITLQWQNVGLAPTYETWSVNYELRDAAGHVAWSGTSSMQPRRFLPAAAPTSVSDLFALPATLAPGAYDLVLIVRDPSGYRAPLPLAVQGRRTDGSYLLRAVTIGATMTDSPCH